MCSSFKTGQQSVDVFDHRPLLKLMKCGAGFR